nr:ABC transporter ATP-binding protein [uncultured Acetobacterium sp.]
MLELNNISCGYNKMPIYEEINFTVHPGSIVCIMGRNGIGKTTLLKTILGSLNILNGSITLNGKDILSYSNKERAQQIGYVPQSHVPPFPYSVRDVVVMGRTPHLSIFSVPGDSDYSQADEILKKIGIEYLKEKIYTEISGGERQLVIIARALIQNPKILIMDEPTASLDYGNQIKIINTIKALAKEKISIIMTTHHPEQAFECADLVVAMTENRVISTGLPAEVLTEKLIEEIYGVKVTIQKINVEGKEKIICLSK